LRLTSRSSTFRERETCCTICKQTNNRFSSIQGINSFDFDKFDNMSKGVCLVCGSSDVAVSQGNILEDQLTIIFFLEKLFPFQRDSVVDLEELLVSRGHPTEWVQFCSNCHDGVDKGRSLFFQMTKCQKQLDQVKAAMKKKFRQSWLKCHSFSKLDEIIRKGIYKEGNKNI